MHSVLLACVLLGDVGTETFEQWVVDRAALAAARELPHNTATVLAAQELAELANGSPQAPWPELLCGVRAADGAIWAGSPRGLMLLEPNAARWRLFHSQRYLPDDRVEALALDADGRVWARTPEGLACLAERELTLDQKASEINDILQSRHIRHGQIGSIQLADVDRPEAGGRQSTNDNDGLWTSMYVGAAVFRYAVTRDPQAKLEARRALETLMFMERVTGISGFVARSYVPIADDPRGHGGEWHRSRDGVWWWKGDTSSDEIDGHYFAYALYYDLAATDAEREEIRGYVRRITDHIIDHGFYYVGPPGKPTTWGVWAPEAMNHDLEWLAERGLNSLELLSHLKVAEHIVGDPRYTAILKELIERHAYATNTVMQKLNPPDELNHSDDELAFLAYYPLLIYEQDPAVRKYYLASVERSFQIERPEVSPLFHYIYAAALQANRWTDAQARPPSADVDPAAYDHDACLEWFRRVPLDLRQWRMDNRGRRDVFETGVSRFGQPVGREVLPIDERCTLKWNSDPYLLVSGGSGAEEDDGTFFLLPYWMGKYHRFVEN